MRAHRSDCVAIPLGHVECPRLSREVSHLTTDDLDTPAVWRRASAPQEWSDLPPEQRAAFLELAIGKWREMFGEAAEPAIEIARRCWR